MDITLFESKGSTSTTQNTKSQTKYKYKCNRSRPLALVSFGPKKYNEWITRSNMFFPLKWLTWYLPQRLLFREIEKKSYISIFHYSNHQTKLECNNLINLKTWLHNLKVLKHDYTCATRFKIFDTFIPKRKAAKGVSQLDLIGMPHKNF